MSAPAVVVTTPAELRELVRQAVADALAASAQPADRLDPRRAAALAGVSRRAILDALRRRELTATRPGRAYMLERQAVLAWAAARSTARQARPVATEAVGGLSPELGALVSAGRLRRGRQ